MRLYVWSSILAVAIAVSVVMVACGSSNEATGGNGADGGTQSGQDGGTGGDSGAQGDSGAADSGLPAPGKNIKHVVVIVQENHTFDAYFGHYCRADAGANPTCTTGPDCCEAAPVTDPNGFSPTPLDDTENAAFDPDHTTPCETSEIDDGGMDHYTQGSTGCGDNAADLPKKFAVATGDVMLTYHGYAENNALADRYFQPVIGSSSSNDMYFAVTHFEFEDNTEKPTSNGSIVCTVPGSGRIAYTEQTIGDLLTAGGHSWAYFAEGYAAMLAATACPSPPSDCPFHLPITPCDYDCSDVPFEYYAQYVDNPTYMKDFTAFDTALIGGTLPDVSFIKGLGYHNEHPGYSTVISMGTAFVDGVVQKVLASPYQDDTLILVTWDEGGGFYDHISPPGINPADMKPYGTRVPLIAIGNFARYNYVSHVQMEHSSIIRFLEWNFLDEQVGQLGQRDANVHSIQSLLDPTKTKLPAD